MMTAVAAGVTFAAASEARADVADTGSANTSIGNAALKYDYTKGLDTTIETGYFGPKQVQVNAKIKMDPVKNGGPLFTIDMPKGAVVEASWNGDKNIVLKAVNGSQTDGTVTVRHTLTPSLAVKVDAFGLKATFEFNALDLLSKINGGSFKYDSSAKQQFAPWAFQGVATKLNAPDLDGSDLFDPIGFDQFPAIVADNLGGSFTVRAITKPTFTYKTTKVTLQGASAPITAQGGQATIAAIDGDFMEVMAQVEGEMAVAGTMDITPSIAIDRVLDYNVSLDFGVAVAHPAYTVPAQKVAFQSALVHIPLPNVHAPTKGVDLGAVKAGGTAMKTVTIQNTGEKAAVLSFKSSDPAFEVPGGQINVEPKGSYDLQIKFSPSGAGAASSDITVLSNDPDSPEQTFKIGANGADVGSDDGSDGDADLPDSASAGDSGCGCTTAGSSSLPSWAGFGLLGLGALVLTRRRRAA
jgi:MYXO-CTERM domain-containing protein